MKNPMKKRKKISKEKFEKRLAAQEKRRAKRLAAKELLQDSFREILTEEEMISKSEHKQREKTFLLLRNGLVFVAAVLFVSSFFLDNTHQLRGIAYIFGAVAYLSELLLLTDCFTKRVPHDELFMIYCFGPLYVLMGIGYFLG